MPQPPSESLSRTATQVLRGLPQAVTTVTWSLVLRWMVWVSRRWLAGWWHMVALGVRLLGLSLRPASYRGAPGQALLAELYLATWPGLPGFTVLATLVSVVLIRVVLVTALSYGLSQLALEMVVRVLVLELIPLAAALYVALRYSVPAGTQLYKWRTRGGFDQLLAQGLDPLNHLIWPQALGAMFAVVALTLLNGLLVLVLTYLMGHGITLAAFDAYTRTVGRVFSPEFTLIFSLKTLAFAATVGLVSTSTALRDLPQGVGRVSVELQSLLRAAAVILLVELLSLLGNYF